MRFEERFRRWHLIVLVVVIYGCYMAIHVSRSYRRIQADARTVRRIVTSEELILELTPELKRLAHGAMNLRIPDYDGRSLFEDDLKMANLAAEETPELIDQFESADVVTKQWPVESSLRDTTLKELNLWPSLIADVDYFEHAKFYFIDGQFIDDDFRQFDSNIGFKGLAKTKSGTFRGIKARQRVQWTRNASSEEAEAQPWRIHSWQTVSMRTLDSPRLLFVESLDFALPSPRDYRRARQSLHEEQLKEYYDRGAKQLPYRFFSPISANLKPGLSVVDIDRDGFDDLYVTVREGRNQLLHNQGDGTFVEIAGRLGIDVEGHSTCAIFADFDNDDDPDLMLGRSLQRSMYFENTGSRFRQREFMLGNQPLLPYLAVSMSAADYNRDGLLDVYISTYRPAMLEHIVSHEQERLRDSQSELPSAMDSVASQAKKWPDQFLPEHLARQYYHRFEQSRKSEDEYGNLLDQIGPPNVLLVNRGNGKFELSEVNKDLAIWRNSLQATWSDFDEDGDPDLYIANDWATDNLMRNDGDAGFTDITEEAKTNEFGFAMGATWGDYDNDGYQDLYVSNMYSKAGRRITKRISELNPNYVQSVVGNYLYRQSDGQFQQVAGLETPSLAVAEAGWSWGGQFSDFDNDGFLDLYVLSGYFTPPKGFASDVDL